MITVRCKNNGTTIQVPEGCNLEEVYQTLQLDMPYGVVSAKVNNRVEGLHFKLFNNKDVEFLDITSASGMRTYLRSLFFVLAKAVSELLPEGHLVIGTPVSKGYFCELHLGREVTLEEVDHIRQRMREIINANLPFRRLQVLTEEAIRLFEEQGMMGKVKLLRSNRRLYTYYYNLDGFIDYFYGSLLTSTSGLKVFDVVKYSDGLLLRTPSIEDPTRVGEIIDQNKMLEVFKEHHRWQKILGISTVGELNEAVEQGHTTELINVSEALQEKKIAQIADEIAHRNAVKIVLVSGPSSSGKTTFSKRLSVQLMACGLRPVPISLDDYFLNREQTPLDENGEYDFESVNALDIPFFNQQLQQLLDGEEIELPKYNFHTGERENSGQKLRIDPQMVLVLEGIHALNPILTQEIPDHRKYKIYASALTTILLDDHNYIPTTDNRLLRRIIRDYKYRSNSAQDTIHRWPSVRRGEEKWIFPYQENADAMFNSALLFELAVIRNQALPLLEEVPESAPEYSEACRLIRFLRYFHPVSDQEIPPTSLLREFLGGSSFHY